VPPPVLNPAARLVWRSARSIQLELGASGVVVDGLAASAVRDLVSAGPQEAARTRDGAGAARAIRALLEAGYLWPRTETPDDERLCPPRPRLAAELGALSATHGERAAELLAARRHVSVVVHGDGRVGPHVAAVLAAAGVGRVHVAEQCPVKLHRTMPGGLTPDDEGAILTRAAALAVRRAAPDTDTTMGERPDLVVLACDAPVDGERREALHARDRAHLVVRMGVDHGVVGPLVIPGLTSCLRCADLHRLDRDPLWTALAVQLAVPPRRDPGTSVALATVVAGIAARQALAFLDGDPPAAIEATLEVHEPDWRIRRRSWPVHPDCDCTGSTASHA
jgi:bacteriocin biosynthesis cyclodehydratase domain-containing protein